MQRPTIIEGERARSSCERRGPWGKKVLQSPCNSHGTPCGFHLGMEQPAHEGSQLSHEDLQMAQPMRVTVPLANTAMLP
jgi:hypothetical protein